MFWYQRFMFLKENYYKTLIFSSVPVHAAITKEGTEMLNSHLGII